jgi:hypothetical protein
MASEEPEGSLRFERADYDQAPADFRCDACGQDVWKTYYAVNGRTYCERCKADLEMNANRGSGAARFAKATLLGLGAGAVGAGVWYAVRATTGYELGLIAIGVGLFVGAAVRKGSAHRGGWRYQALAIFLTYASIVSTYVPDVLSGLREMAEKGPEASLATSAPAGAEPDAAGAVPAAAEAAPSSQEAVSPTGVLLALVVFGGFVLAIAFAAPFLGGVQNIMGIVIIGIALYEAWKMNRAAPLEITGPHRVGTNNAPAAPSRGPELG